MRFCAKHGIDEEVCNFANRLVNFPEKMIPKLLKNRRLKEYLAKRSNFTLEELDIIAKETEIVWKIKTGKICDECSFRVKCKFKDFKVKPSYYYLGRAEDTYKQHVYLVINVQENGKLQKLCLNEDKYRNIKNIIIMPNSNINLNEFAEYKMNCPIPPKHSQYRDHYPNSIYHERLHDYSIDNPYIKLIREIARYFYGNEGIKAVELHLELDEIDHILGRLKQRIPAYISRGLSGKTSDRETRKYMACSSFIRRYIFKKPQNILRSLKPSNLYHFK